MSFFSWHQDLLTNITTCQRALQQASTEHRTKGDEETNVIENKKQEPKNKISYIYKRTHRNSLGHFMALFHLEKGSRYCTQNLLLFIKIYIKMGFLKHEQ